MKTLFYIVAGGTLIGVVVFMRIWFKDEGALTERWVSRYDNPHHRLQDADDPSRLDRLRKIAAAQHGQDQ